MPMENSTPQRPEGLLAQAAIFRAKQDWLAAIKIYLSSAQKFQCEVAMYQLFACFDQWEAESCKKAVQIHFDNHPIAALAIETLIRNHCWELGTAFCNRYLEKLPLDQHLFWKQKRMDIAIASKSLTPYFILDFVEQWEFFRNQHTHKVELLKLPLSFDFQQGVPVLKDLVSYFQKNGHRMEAELIRKKTNYLNAIFLHF
jgi:hypothetical protein